MAENGVRHLVREYLKGLRPGTIVEMRDVYASVQERRPETAEPTIREALQALSAGSSRGNGSERAAAKVVAVAARLPELRLAGRRERVYLAVPEIDRDHLGRAAALRKVAAQERCTALLGKEVVDFWLKQTQLQCMPEKAAREVRAEGECRICRFLADRHEIPMPAPGTVTLQAAHLVERKNAFWRIMDEVVSDQEPRWIFSDAGALALRKRIEADATHSSSKYMILLCKKHDDALQASLNPRLSKGAKI
jgi:hypothetical protein